MMIFNQTKVVSLDMIGQAAQQLLESWRKQNV
jgi:hypothetical protein